MARKSNQILAQEFRALLTEGAKLHFDDAQLAITKTYRGDLWKAFREIEDRLCPTPEIARRYMKGEDK